MKNIDKFSYDIFTDDEDWVKNQKLFNSAKNIFGENNNIWESQLLNTKVVFVR